MKVLEVKQVEEIVNKMAENNGEVYDMNVSLAVAKAIQGLRAVFDEVGVCSLVTKDKIDFLNYATGNLNFIHFFVYQNFIKIINIAFKKFKMPSNLCNKCIHCTGTCMLFS